MYIYIYTPIAYCLMPIAQSTYSPGQKRITIALVTPNNIFGPMFNRLRWSPASPELSFCTDYTYTLLCINDVFFVSLYAVVANIILFTSCAREIRRVCKLILLPQSRHPDCDVLKCV